MKSFDSAITTEQAKEAFREVALIEFDFDTPLYYVDAGVPVYAGGQLYQAGAFRINRVQYGTGFSADVVEIEVGAVDQVMVQALLSADERGSACVISLCYLDSDYQSLGVAELWRGQVNGWTLKETRATLEIVNELHLWGKKTLRKCSASCAWVFGGDECGYSGGETWCDRTYERCEALSNTASFGGFRFLPVIQEREIWWGRSRKG